MTVAALYVQRGGCYYGLDDVDPWDKERDARLYPGPHPVVAHPPCARWCLLAPLVEYRYGIKRGEDGGCFAAALSAVRTWGGVLEHPAWSAAFPAYDIAQPTARGGWQRTMCGGWTCEVDQALYGHRARKRTWLYAFGIAPPPLLWGSGRSRVWMTWLTRRGDGSDMTAPSGERMGKRERNATPLLFRDMLLSISRSIATEGER